MRLETEFYQLALKFDVDRLTQEAQQWSEQDWRPHPQGHAGNSALPLIASGGDPDDHSVKGTMLATPYLERCPYVRQVLAALGTVLGRTRFMRIADQAEATPHVDTNYYWLQRVRVHVPVVTFPEVRFICNEKQVHMAAGETWIFDTFCRHNVLNPTSRSRIHLVSDTTGSDSFWDLVDQARKPFAEGPETRLQFRTFGFRPEKKVKLETEQTNLPVIMSPWEQKAMIDLVIGDVDRNAAGASVQLGKLEAVLERFSRKWRSLWDRHGDGPEGWDAFGNALEQIKKQLQPFVQTLTLGNGMDVVSMLGQAIIRPALNPDLATTSGSETPRPSASSRAAIAAPATVAAKPKPLAVGSAAGKPTHDPIRFERPLFIVSAPRSGSTMLFEALTRSPDLWTIGGESHGVFESIERLRPDQRDFESNRLAADDADAPTAQRLREIFGQRLRDRKGNPPPPGGLALRMLEKTPKNALRVPFLRAVFPDALFVYLFREPRGAISSILDAWGSGKFVTYPQLPGWEGQPWSLLLVPGWRELSGKSAAEVAAAQWCIANRVLMDDLGKLPQSSWCGISYDEILQDAQAVMRRLCAFAGVRWDQAQEGPLPLSRHTLTPPDAEKWRRNKDVLVPILPGVEPVAAIAATVLAAAAPPEAGPEPRGDAGPNVAGAAPQSSTAPAAAPKADGTKAAPSPLRSVHTSNLADLLTQLRCSLLVTTYQAGRLVVIRADGQQLNTHFRTFRKPMGLAVGGGRMALGTSGHVWELRNVPNMAPKLEPQNRHDACYLPRNIHVTGDIDIHEMALGAGDDVWFVNTRFSCLCTLDRAHSFVPRWRPPFITALSPEDRCHLNGVALRDGKPRYVTAHGDTDTPQGWRDNKAAGGVLMDVESDRVVAAGLSMPHSPRWYDEKLWVLESGAGTISTVDEESGRTQPVAELPGYTRGLDFHGPLAFIGLSQIRESAVFSGIPLTKKTNERNCGIWIVDTRNGKTVAFLRFDDQVQEIFAVQVLPGARYPEIVNDDERLIGSAYIMPDEALADVAAPRVPVEA